LKVKWYDTVNTVSAVLGFCRVDESHGALHDAFHYCKHRGALCVTNKKCH
jgi:hypothetical protein